MAYIAPTTRTTGDLVTAAIWNADIVANEVAINAGAVAIAGQAIGDLVIATSASQLGRVADVATGSVLVSGGVTTAPAYSASPGITALTYTTNLKSTTALATPSALSATQATKFASTVSGAAIMGFGTTNDVSLMNRAGTVVLGVGPNTTAVNMTGALAVTGVATFTADVLTVAWTDYTASSTIVGWTSFVSGKKWILYKKLGKLVFVQFYIEGTSNSTSTTFTLPFASYNNSYGQMEYGAVLITTQNSGSFVGPGVAMVSAGSSTVNVFSSTAQLGWTASSTKAIGGSFWYESA